MYKIYSTLYLDSINETYKRVIAIDRKPDNGPLVDYIKQINKTRLSPFDITNNCVNNQCINVICDFKNKTQYLCIDQIVELFDFLTTNGYTINDTLTKLISKNRLLNKNDEFICIISL